MTVEGWEYALVFVLTLTLTLFLTPLALRFALRRGVLDHPGMIKAQASPVPYLGGAAILASFVLVVLGAAMVERSNASINELVVILGLAAALAVVGLLDDLRGLSPVVRLVVEIGAGIAVWATPAGADVFANDIANVVVTVLWIVGVTNAFNLLDNMDGLSAGVAAIASFFIFVLAIDNEQVLVAVLAIALVGCAAGFLRSNFHPARIYMGDAGALFLGFLLAVLSLKLDFVHGPRFVALSVPVLLLGVALFDTVLVSVNRLRHGRSPLSGGRDHTSHRLVFVGIPVPVAVGLVYLVAASLGVQAVVLSRLDRNPALLLLGWVGAVALGLGLLLSAVPVYESSRRRHLMIQEVARHEEPLDGADSDDEEEQPPSSAAS
jgi:UDP-GlcNAc:undecaprenyl-phosphate GlcNAc-1-phosphate transferase